jgi:hypothetical protein
VSGGEVASSWAASSTLADGADPAGDGEGDGARPVSADGSRLARRRAGEGGALPAGAVGREADSSTARGPREGGA